MSNQTVTLYGASDDCVEIDGVITEEWPYEDEGVVAFSDGTVLSIRYTDDGIWRIAPLSRGSALLDIEQAVSADDDNYSDRATLTGVDGALRWAVYGKEFVSAR